MKIIPMHPEGEGAAPVDPLDDLAAQAQALDAAGAPSTPDAAPAEAAPPALTNAQCLMMAGQTVREALCAFAKVQSPKSTLDDGTLQTVADAIAPVLDKYGVNLASVAGDYMAELRAAIVTVPVILAARAGLIAEIAASKASKTEAPAAPVAVVSDGG